MSTIFAIIKVSLLLNFKEQINLNLKIYKNAQQQVAYQKYKIKI